MWDALCGLFSYETMLPVILVNAMIYLVKFECNEITIHRVN